MTCLPIFVQGVPKRAKQVSNNVPLTHHTIVIADLGSNPCLQGVYQLEREVNVALYYGLHIGFVGAVAVATRV